MPTFPVRCEYGGCKYKAVASGRAIGMPEHIARIVKENTVVIYSEDGRGFSEEFWAPESERDRHTTCGAHSPHVGRAGPTDRRRGPVIRLPGPRGSHDRPA
jgi:hypothetical protein